MSAGGSALKNFSGRDAGARGREVLRGDLSAPDSAHPAITTLLSAAPALAVDNTTYARTIRDANHDNLLDAAPPVALSAMNRSAIRLQCQGQPTQRM